jgi:hypothetical protein
MRLALVCALSVLAAVTPAQDTRPKPVPTDTRPSSGAIFVIGATDAGDRIFRIDDQSLSVLDTFSVYGSHSYARLTPDGESVIVATSRPAFRETRPTVFALVPQGFEVGWIASSESRKSWQSGFRKSDVLIADSTFPDAIEWLGHDGFEVSDGTSGVSSYATILKRSGVQLMVPLQVNDMATHMALWNQGGQGWIIAVTYENHVWRIAADNGAAQQVTTRPVVKGASALGVLLGEPSGLHIETIVMAQSEQKAVCFARTGECFVVDLMTGRASQQQLPAGPVRDKGISFVRHSENAGRYVICTRDNDCGGDFICVLGSDLRELGSIAVKGDTFIDAVFSADGVRFATLTSQGMLRIHDASSGVEIRRSVAPLPLIAVANYCASIAGWR